MTRRRLDSVSAAFARSERRICFFISGTVIPFFTAAAHSAYVGGLEVEDDDDDDGERQISHFADYTIIID